jgi:hypothetical protein
VTAVTENESDLWGELCEIIGYHAKPGDDCIETLNRLLHKHPAVKPPLLAKLMHNHPAPKPSLLAIRITRETHRLSVESWDPGRLWMLILPSQVTHDPPRSDQEAVIIARFEGADYLIDGRPRINLWKREGLPWERRVLVIEVAPCGHES